MPENVRTCPKEGHSNFSGGGGTKNFIGKNKAKLKFIKRLKGQTKTISKQNKQG